MGATDVADNEQTKLVWVKIEDPVEAEIEMVKEAVKELSEKYRVVVSSDDISLLDADEVRRELANLIDSLNNPRVWTMDDELTHEQMVELKGEIEELVKDSAGDADGATDVAEDKQIWAVVEEEQGTPYAPYILDNRLYSTKELAEQVLEEKGGPTDERGIMKYGLVTDRISDGGD